MKRLFALMCATTMIGAGLSAQTPGARADKMPGMHDGAVTVSGCVEAGADDASFMLTGATSMGEAKSPDHAKAPGASGGHLMSYHLVGGELKGHLGHRVELVGTMSKTDTDRMAKMHGMDRAARDTMMADKSTKAMTLNVTSVKMIAATCS